MLALPQCFISTRNALAYPGWGACNQQISPCGHAPITVSLAPSVCQSREPSFRCCCLLVASHFYPFLLSFLQFCLVFCCLFFQSLGAVRKSRWPSWAPVPNKPTVSVDVKQHFNNQRRPESRRDQEEGGDLDSHEELDNHLRVQARPRRGRRCWTLKRARERSRAGLRNLLLQLFLNSCATDNVTLLRTAVETVIAEYTSCYAMARSPLP